MDGGENVKVRDRVELSLDGRQIASVVVGALVLLGVVFVLGLNVGRQLALRQLDASRADVLAALDMPPPAPALSQDALTFHDRLTKDKAPPPEPVTVPAPPPPARPEAGKGAAPPAAAAKAEPAAKPEAAGKTEPGPKAGPKPEAAAKAEPAVKPEPGPKPEAAAKGAFAVQVTATPSRAEADRLAQKLKEYAPRVEEAEVAGKGKVYRVRVGAFASRAEAEKFLKGFNGKTGSKGLVVASR